MRQVGGGVLGDAKIVAGRKGARQAGGKVLGDAKIVARLSRPYSQIRGDRWCVL